MHADFDALVIGGGPAGSAAALLLAQAGWKVALFEKQRFPRRKVCGEFLSATNQPLLERLGVAEVLSAERGPPVTDVGVCAGRDLIVAPLPGNRQGYAIRREVLDAVLLDRARALGAKIFQPVLLTELQKTNAGYLGRGHFVDSREAFEVSAALCIAAHGSWESGGLPSQLPRVAPKGSDLLGFKAHLMNSGLPDGLMPLLAFPDGYGGLVRIEGGRVSLSCCVQRSRLEKLNRSADGSAGAAVFAHILETCPAARPFLDCAREDGGWLAIGPIRPGVRCSASRGLFKVGNAAGEAHPAIAEGISIALQSAYFLTQRLLALSMAQLAAHDFTQAEKLYAQDFRRHFGLRIRSSALIARLAMAPRAAGAIAELLKLRPSLLTWGAQLAGKSKQIAALS